jgi:hypothetical protein
LLKTKLLNKGKSKVAVFSRLEKEITQDPRGESNVTGKSRLLLTGFLLSTELVKDLLPTFNTTCDL